MIGPFDGDGRRIELTCDCGQEATVPTKGYAAVIGVIGMRLLMDPPLAKPPEDFLPDAIQCRKCGRLYAAGVPA